MEKIDAEIWRERVKGPGKYEGEPAWVAFAWEEIVLDGNTDTRTVDGTDFEIVKLGADVRAAFPDAPERAALYQRTDGFVCRADLAEVLSAPEDGPDDAEPTDADALRERVVATLLALLQPGAHDRPELRKILGLTSWADLDERLSEARSAVEIVLGE